MKILVVSSYAPMPCGVGRYAEQQVIGLQREGHCVDVLSPYEGNADFQEDLLGGFRPLRLLKYVWAYELTYIHFVPFFFYESHSAASRIRTSTAFVCVMWILALLRGLTGLLAWTRLVPRIRSSVAFVIHETEYKVGSGARGRYRSRIDRLFWTAADRVIFHSSQELDSFARYYRISPGHKGFEIWPHDKYFTPLCDQDQAAVRRRLDLEPDAILLLCLGFVQPHKGFERALYAMNHVSAGDVRLKIVGSVRLEWDKAHQYATWLHDLAALDPRCEFIETYLSDEMFDAWIVAADYIIIPYHEIWTSGVAARAKIYNKPILAANTGGLAEQLTAGSHLFSSDAELGAIIERVALPARVNGRHAQVIVPAGGEGSTRGASGVRG